MLQPNEEATNFTFRYFQFYIIKKLSIILLHLTLALISTTKEFNLRGFQNLRLFHTMRILRNLNYVQLLWNFTKSVLVPNNRFSSLRI